MSPHSSEYLQSIAHLPEGATLVLREFDWEDYEQLLKDLRDRPHLRVAYDEGRLEIISPLPEHEEYARFVDDLVRAIADSRNIRLQKYGSATWKRQQLAKGAEADCCFYVDANAERVTGKRQFDLATDPPPDIVVEIDISNESLSKFPIYAALRVPEIWRYDGKTMNFYALADGKYHKILSSLSFPKLEPQYLADALNQSKSDGQTAALEQFRNLLKELEGSQPR